MFGASAVERPGSGYHFIYPVDGSCHSWESDGTDKQQNAVVYLLSCSPGFQCLSNVAVQSAVGLNTGSSCNLYKVGRLRVQGAGLPDRSS